MKRRKKTILVLYSVLLAAFSVYFLLDTFVIERVYSAEAPAAVSQSAAEESPAAEQSGAEKNAANTLSSAGTSGKHGKRRSFIRRSERRDRRLPGGRSGSDRAFGTGDHGKLVQ